MAGSPGITRILLEFLLLLALLSMACNSERVTIQQPIAPQTTYYSVGETFEDFYAQLGGEEALGPCISPVFTREEMQYQYTVAALLVYNPNAPISQRYGLGKIGSELGLEGAAGPRLNDPSLIDLGGYLIWNELVPVYRELGPEILGEPITGVLFDETRARYEQFFENAGFYRDWADDPGAVQWLPYGSWMCAKHCLEVEDIVVGAPPTPVTPPPAGEIASAILAVAERLGLLYTGHSLSGAYQAEDGFYEMVFENVVLFVDPQNLGQVYLRPLPQLVGITPDPPVSRIPIPGMRFYQTMGELGYNVPQNFMDFITLHGTIELSGYPISEIHPKGEGVSYQCFTNLCLEYHANAPEGLRVRPSALGMQYLNRVDQPGEQETQSSRVSLQVWERYPLLSPGQEQEINVLILDGNQPLENVAFSLLVQYPDGTEGEIFFPPTDVNGQSFVRLDQIMASDGTVVPYQICLLGLYDPALCYSENFVIWSTP